MARILAIDDNQDDLTTISALLEKLIPNCDVVSAESGAEGIEKAKAEAPDTILLDIAVPNMDAFEVCKRLKSDSETKHIPVIMLTESTTEAKRRIEGLETGVESFLVKPIDEVELVSQVNLALRIKGTEEKIKALREREQELTIRNQIAETFLTTPREEFYAEVLQVVLEAMKSKYGTFGYIDQNGALVCPSWTKGIWNRPHGQNEKLVIPRDTWAGVWGQCLLEKKTICLNESQRVPEADMPMSRILSVPIMYHGKANGLLYVADKPTDYDEHDRQLLETIANCIVPVLHAILQRNKEESERKQAQEEKRGLEARLQQAQKIQAIGTLAGGIAHDFNNILAAILGYAELVRLQIPDGSRAKDNLQEVLVATYRARDLVKQILAFGRQSQQERKPVYVHLIAKEGLKLLRASLPSTIEIRQNIAYESDTVMADPGEIHQILMNLCTNAHEAMREKGGMLEVTCTPVELGVDDAARYPDVKPGRYLRLSVSDTGHGMYRHTVDRVFDPYFTTKEKGPGTGLGLAVVHGIVSNLGGMISVYSEPGKGTTFHVYLPRVDSKLEPESKASEPLPTGNERILFVDDEEPLVDMGRQLLTHLGYQVVTRTSSTDALGLFRKQPDQFDLVITDMTMPNMTGDKLAKELMGIRPDIPIILCTGFSELITQEEAKEVGIREFVMKPIASSEIAVVIRRALSSTEARSSNGES